nr:putative ribonuclease H-like domain-containing protein [Tanacetum cinerariifolium]
MNKLVNGNLVRGLPLKVFENNHTCVACKKGKQHKASCKSKPVSYVSHPLQRLHMDLFGPTFVKILNKKSYCLVVTDDYSRFSLVFFLATKDETSRILKTFITGIENQINHRVKIIRSDNGTEFKNQDLNQFCGMKGIKREFSVARTPQQNGAEAVNTAYYVQNRVLVTKPHNKTSYELLLGRTPSIGFMRPFGCPITILNTLDPLEKFDGKADEGFLVGYSVNSKAFRVFNSRTRIVQETLHINFLENQPNITGSGPKWLFDFDTLTQSMNYQPVVAENQPNHSACIKENLYAGTVGKATESTQQYALIPLWSNGSKDPQNTDADAAFDVKANENEFMFLQVVVTSQRNMMKRIKEKLKKRVILSYFPITTNVTIPRRRQRKQNSNIVEPEIRTIVEIADNCTMAQMLQAPIEGYEDAIAVPPINANNFELKQTLINLVQSNQFTGRQDPHNHLRFFNKVTSTFRHPEVPNTTIKLLLFPFSLEGEAQIWLDKEPLRSILTWEDLVLKFINQVFPPSKTTYLRNEIINFLQKPNETFNEACERFKDLLRQCPHHGFSELHQLDTFYNELNPNDQDALDSAAG